jgi:hypothetical protein
MATFNNTIQWYESPELDDPKLRSPTPCPRGVYCQYKLPNPETKELELACCRMVHPGEEGNGRRLFPARTAPDGRHQPACVRLTGNALFYERCRLKVPWRRFAAQRGIPLPPADVPWVQVQRGPILPNPQAEINERHRAMKRYHHLCVAERRAPQPPPRITLSGGGGPSYGFTLPPLIQRTRTERLYEEAHSPKPSLIDPEDDTHCVTPSLLTAQPSLCEEGAMEALD